MKKLLLALGLLWPIGALAQGCPSAGSLLIQKNLSEIAGCGSGAQSAARVNLGLGNVPLTVPTAPFLAGVGGSLIGGTVGTGLSGSGSTLSVLYGTTTGTALQGSLLGAANGVASLDGSGLVPAAQLRAPTATTLGAVESVAAVTHQFLTSLSTAGAFSQAQPAFGDISGAIASGQVSGPYAGITGVGTLASGIWNATAIGAAYGGTGSASAPTSGQIPIGNAGGTAYAPQSLTGDVSLSNTGVTSVGNLSSVTNASLANSGLAHPGLTLGSAALTLGATTTTIGGLTLTSPTFSGTVAGAGTIPSSVLANTAVTAASYGSSSSIPSFTVNAEGQLTAAAGNAVVAPAATLTGSTLAPGVVSSSLTSLGGGSVGTAAYVNTGTSGATIPLLNGANTFSGADTFSSTPTFSTGTIDLAGGSNISSNSTQVAFATSHGQVGLFYDNGVVPGGKFEFETNTTGNAATIQTTDNTGGIRFLSPTQVEYNWAYSGLNSSVVNTNFQAISSITSGTSANTSQYFINQIGVNPAIVSGQSMFALSVTDAQQAGFIGSSNALFVATNQVGVPGTLTAWGSGQTISAIGALRTNGVFVYQAENTGTTGASAPTCSSSTCSDGAITWLAVNTISQFPYTTTLGVQTNLTYNVGGTSSAFQGFAFAGGCTANLSGNATYYSEEVGCETDSFNTLSSGSPFRQAIHQFVKTGNGAHEDWGISIAGKSYNAAVFQTAVMPNGVGIAFMDQSVAGLQTMAGAFDCIMCSTTGTNTTSGILVSGGGGYIVRAPNLQLLGSGDIQTGYLGVHQGASGPILDTTYEVLLSVGSLSGGANWTTGMYAVDDYGNVGTVTAAAGVPSAVTISSLPKTYVATASLPGGSVTWHAMQGNASILDTNGGATVPSNFTVASETYSAQTTIGIGTASATAINIGNSGSATTIAGSVTHTALAGTGSRPVCVTSAGLIEVGSLSAGLVTCP